MVRTFGRKGRWKRVITTPYPSLQAAWPFIRATVKTRLRHRYRNGSSRRAAESG